MSLFNKPSTNKQFETHIRPHLADLYRLAFRLTGTREDAEDLVQEMVLKVHKGRHKLQELDNPRTWLAKVMYRMFVDEYRRAQRQPVHSLEQDVEESEIQSVSVVDAEELIQQRQLVELVGRAIQMLSDEHRILILMFEVEGYSLAEMQEILELPLGTLKSRLHRARHRLREILEIHGTFSEASTCKEQRV